MDRASSDVVRALGSHTLLTSQIDYIIVGQDGGFLNGTFGLVSKQMETGMKAPGEKARRTAMESFTTLTKASSMKAFGWME